MAGAAAAWATLRLLDDGPTRDAVRAGYIDGWRRFAADNEENRRAFDALRDRMPKYAAAAADEMAQDVGTYDNPISDAFASLLAAAVGLEPASLPAPSSNDLGVVVEKLTDSDKRANARLVSIGMLAVLTAPVIFDAYQQLSGQALAEAGLVGRRIKG